MYEEVPEVLKKYYPGGIFGSDLDGRPVYYEPIGRVDFFGILHSASKEEVVNYRRLQCEQLRDISKQQEKELGKDLETYSTLVLDAKGGGRKHLWKPGIENYQAILQLYENEFPNLRERILVVNTPTIFPIIFAFLKPFISASTSNKMKILGSNWKRELQKYINKDQIPEYYGGTAKDNNDDPKCQEFICFGGEVPRNYYKNDVINRDEFDSIHVKAGDTFTKEIEINDLEKSISYQFITSDFNIKFSIKYKSTDTGVETTLVKEKKFDSQLIIQEGVVKCESKGTYIFIFDNSYSWFRDKELFYLLKIV